MKKKHQKRDDFDRQRYLDFEEAAAFMGGSRRTFATLVAELKEFVRLRDMVAEDCSEFRGIGKGALRDQERVLMARFGRGVVDFPTPLRRARKYYFERARLQRVRDLKAGVLPLP